MSVAKRRQFAPVFAALGDETRLRLVAKLCAHSPQSISELTEDTRLTRQAITKHLAALENAGLVRGLKRGRENLFALEPKPLAEAQVYLNRVSALWDQALSRLKALAEEA